MRGLFKLRGLPMEGPWLRSRLSSTPQLPSPRHSRTRPHRFADRHPRHLVVVRPHPAPQVQRTMRPELPEGLLSGLGYAVLTHRPSYPSQERRRPRYYIFKLGQAGQNWRTPPMPVPHGGPDGPSHPGMGPGGPPILGWGSVNPAWNTLGFLRVSLRDGQRQGASIIRAPRLSGLAR